METTVVERVWTKSKLLIKALIIGGMVLLLMIPTFYVQSLIEEREARQREAIAEVSSKWAGHQNITGPVVVLPYWQDEGDSAKKVRTRHFASFLPDELTVQSTVTPQEKHRGIYKVMLYTSKNNLSGSFQNINLKKLNLPENNILWNEAFLLMHISDTKGLNDELIMNWNNRPLTLTPQTGSNPLANEGLMAPLNLTGAKDLENIRFSSTVTLSGSEHLLFTPIGKTTSVQLESSWPHPSFTGDILPQSSEVKKSGFTASWKSLAFKRNFPQQWKDGTYRIADANAAYGRRPGSGMTTAATYDVATVAGNNNIAASSFGVDLFVPVNGYQKTMRSIKYAALFILLTFASFFIIETTNNRSVHPFQYGLIGVALVLFYTLLLSFSEYTGFNAAYIISSLATLGLIAWFVKGILASARLSMLVALVLVLMYTYVFTILQLQDYALLLGSIGLFLTLAVIMNFSKKVQW